MMQKVVKLLVLVLTLGICVSAWGGDVVVVSQGGMADEFVAFIEANFPDVTILGAGTYDDSANGNPPSGWPSLAPDDLVIVARWTNSGAYDESGAEIDWWNGIPNAMLLCNGYLGRNNRWDWTNSDGLILHPSAGAETEILVPSDLVFAGITIVPGTPDTADLHDEDIRQVNNTLDVGGGQLLASGIGTRTLMARFEAGDALAATGPGALTAHGGKRIYWPLYENGGDNISITSLSADGQQVLINILTELLDVTPPPIRIRSVYPTAGTTEAPPKPGIRVTIEDGSFMVDDTTIALAVDGAGVDPDVSKDDVTTTVAYAFPDILSPLTVITATLTFSDTQIPPVEYVQEWTFTVADWQTLPAEWSYPTASANGATAGLTYSAAQAPLASGLENSAARAVAQLRGKLIDPLTGEPYPNDIFIGSENDPVANPDGTWDLDRVNLSLFDEAVALDFFADQGNFYETSAPPLDDPEQKFPGIPGQDLSNNEDFSVEILAFLELEAGPLTLGVNSDDGFVVYAGPQPRDLFAPDLGRFDGGRGSADTLFSFMVEQAGVYPVRVLYYQGGGNGGLEFFSVDPETGIPALVNMIPAGGLASYRELTTDTTPPYAYWVEPRDGALGVDVGTKIEIELRDGGLAVDTSALTMTLNGAAVTPVVTTPNGSTVVAYTPPGGLTAGALQEVVVSYGDSSDPAAEHTAAFSFTTERSPFTGTIQQDANGLAVFEAENFSANEPMPSHAWVFNTEMPGYAGDGYMQALPDAGTAVIDPDITTLSPRLDYQVNFVKSGTHRVWVRGYAVGGADDSCHAGIGGVPPASAQTITGFTNEEWAWCSGGPYTIEVAATGVQTVNLWMHEDGFRMDSILVTSDLELQPLSAELTSPASRDHFAAGASIALVADASAAGANVALVEFFEGANKLGEAATAPYQMNWASVPAGRYLITAVATDDLGGQATSEAKGITVGNLPTGALYVLNDPNAVNPSDQAIIDRLAGFGFDVQVIGAAASQTSDSDVHELVVVSSTPGSGDVGDKFRDIVIPVVNWEQAVQDNFLMTGNVDGVDRGTIDTQIGVNIVDETHPMAAGFPNGFLLVTSGPAQFSWGLPAATADIVATVFGNPNQVVIYGYDTGAALIDGTPAPARRVMVLLSDNAFVALNDDGVALMDAAVEWALGGAIEPVGIPLAIERVGADLKLAWPTGGAAAALYSAMDLVNPTWVQVPEPVVPEGNANTVTVTPVLNEEHFSLRTP